MDALRRRRHRDRALGVAHGKARRLPTPACRGEAAPRRDAALHRPDRDDERRDVAHERGPLGDHPQPLRRAHGRALALPDPGRSAHAPEGGGRRRRLRGDRGALRAPDGGRPVESPRRRHHVRERVRARRADRLLARVVRSLDPVKLLLAQAALGSAVFIVASALTEHAPTVWTLRLAGALAYQGVLIAGFNFVANLWLLGRYRPSGLAGFFLTQPIFGVTIAALVTGDRLTGDLLLACLAVAVGIGLTAR